jgi:hypothetical protein
MATSLKLIFSILLVMSFSCVQKTKKYPVRCILDVSKLKDVNTAGIRGSGAPLDWQNDFEMKTLIEDSLYVADITFDTGYIGTEIKFTVNGQFELAGRDNRRIIFDTGSDTTIYKAIFDVPDKKQ